jgi:SepF-like predicted cell division protein (DUF552 family)
MGNSLVGHLFEQKFSGLRFKVYLRNETSRTLFSKHELVHLVELKEDGLLLELPVNVCQRGHTLTLFFLKEETELNGPIPNSGALKEAYLQVMAKVENLERAITDTNLVVLDLHFTQYETESWKKILDIFSANQNNVNNKIQKQHIVRGEE